MSDKGIIFKIIDGRKCLTDDQLNKNPVLREFFKANRVLFNRDAFNHAWYLK